jgi:3-hydroxyisobutyrate dehydrogenase-like beta-hydroxyacid dehydrogenase
MGLAIGTVLLQNGHQIAWVGANRSEATRVRAKNAGFETVATLSEALESVDLVLSVCPPHAAKDQALAVSETGYNGRYVDANAVAPDTIRKIDAIFAKSDIRLTDGGIVGPPPKRAGTTRLFLSGSDAQSIVEIFAGSIIEAVPVSERLGDASAVKTAYAAWTKGTIALLLAIRAFARAEGVEATLLAEWTKSQPGLADRDLSGAIAKAWRFVGEMDEIAKAFSDDGLPHGFHAAAAELYQTLSPLKDKWDVSLDEGLALIGERSDGD